MTRRPIPAATIGAALLLLTACTSSTSSSPAPAEPTSLADFAASLECASFTDQTDEIVAPFAMDYGQCQVPDVGPVQLYAFPTADVMKSFWDLTASMTGAGPESAATVGLFVAIPASPDALPTLQQRVSGD